MDGIIYGVRCRCNGKWYIGQTVNYKQRKHNHLRYARHNRDRCVFHGAIRKYGEDGFDWTVLESDIHTYDELNEREKFWIQEKNSLLPNGYNMNAGGNGTPNHHQSEETRKRISATLTGRRQSEETKRKKSAAMKGKPLSEAHRMHISEGRKGMVFTEEHRRHLSEAKKGKKLSEETRKRLSIANKGKKLSEETRKRMSIAKKGKTYSEETRKRISIANAKPVLMFNRNGDFVTEFPSLRAAADYIGVKHSQVSDVLRGKHKTAGGGLDRKAGYTFKYKNEKENPDR